MNRPAVHSTQFDIEDSNPPMPRARYLRALTRLRKGFPWVVKHQIEPGPGHLDILRRLLMLMNEILSPRTLNAIDFLRVSSPAGCFSVHLKLKTCDLERERAVFEVIDECARLAKSTCVICGAQSFGFIERNEQSGFCAQHANQTGRFAEDYSCAPASKTEKEQVQEMLGGLIAASNLRQEKQREQEANALFFYSTPEKTDTLPTIDFLSLQGLSSYCTSARHKSKEHGGQIDAFQEKIRNAGLQNRKLGVIPQNWAAVVDQFETNFPNFIELAELLRDHFALSAFGDKRVALPPILLAGPPGIGKTEATSWLAERLALPVQVFDMASAQSGAQLAGSDTFWSNTQPGKLFELLAFQQYANPLVVLDELDKVGTEERLDPLAALYTLLEPRSAKRFIDLSIRDFSIDASNVNWIATANSSAKLPTPILSRFTVLEIREPDQRQLCQIARTLYQRIRNEASWGTSFVPTVDDCVIEKLVELSPRSINLALRRAFGSAARNRRCNLITEDLPANIASSANGIGFLAPLRTR